MMQDAESRGGAFSFAIMYDGGALAACASSSCNLTNQAISDLTYAFNKHENSPAYMRTGGRPVVFFFDPDRYGTLNWSQVSTSVPGNPIFVFRDPQGFTHSSSGGSFSWVGLNLSNSNDMGLSYFDSFYNTSLGYPQALTFGSGNKGFNDSLAAWSPQPPRVQSQQCGQTWLDTIAEAGKFFSTGRQLHAVQLVTWNDYEEGSERRAGGKQQDRVNVLFQLAGKCLVLVFAADRQHERRQRQCDHEGIDRQRSYRSAETVPGSRQLCPADGVSGAGIRVCRRGSGAQAFTPPAGIHAAVPYSCICRTGVCRRRVQRQQQWQHSRWNLQHHHLRSLGRDAVQHFRRAGRAVAGMG